MRHRIRGRKLGRKTAPREALIRGLARALILTEGGQIVTTISKAKEVRPFVEKLVTLARKGEDYRKRRAEKLLHDKKAVEKLFEELGPRYKDRHGGYTRIIRWDKRLGDKAERAVLQFVTDEDDLPVTTEETGEETTAEDTSTEEAAPAEEEAPTEEEVAPEEEETPEKTDG
jgi:large subunit ribosomal protein L17